LAGHVASAVCVCRSVSLSVCLSVCLSVRVVLRGGFEIRRPEIVQYRLIKHFSAPGTPLKGLPGQFGGGDSFSAV